MTDIPRPSGGISARPLPVGRARDVIGAIQASRWSPRVALAAVVTFAAVFNLWRLSGNAYGNTFYAAAVRSATLSWKNWFFGSFDPGGFITVDKPPVFLWFGGLAARVFGYSSWTLLAPSAIAGAATVGLIWWIVRRYFGAFAATIAAIALVLTPISVAVDRLNLPEPFYILALVGAVAALLRSLESRRWWMWTILAGALVGVAFNTKMLAGWIPGPALALALVVGDGDSWRRPAVKRILMRLAVLAAATFVVSFSWMVLVDAWPASSRPYIGGSTNNTVSNLAFDYNGLGRVEGESRGGGAGRGGPGGGRNFTRPNGGTGGNGGGFPGNFFGNGGTGSGNGGSPNSNGGGVPNGNGGGSAPGGNGGFPGFNNSSGSNSSPFGGTRGSRNFNRNSQTGPGGGTAPNAGNNATGGTGAGNGGANGFPTIPNLGRGGFNATGAGGVIAGSPGLWRMFDDANGGQIAWLLPFALLGSIACLWYWRRDRKRRAAVVAFAGWVLLFGLV
ncbi:MAG TPA: glycosyltransferase family 39 protein, partial [Caulobacteraceae bacterium]|nr:glycosyltransferase family 39 protein [Caulobacteraceae bacterium]